MYRSFKPTEWGVQRENLIKEFHRGMGQPMSVVMTDLNLFELRWNLIKEEMQELNEEFASATVDIMRGRPPENMEDIFKELADLQYVISGFAVTYGIDLESVVREVHTSNMSKLEDGKPVYRDDGKVLKGKNYKPPQLTELVHKMWDLVNNYSRTGGEQ
jgi:predicted HAD superfamily Cof-like phosphohydrolase